MIEHVPHRIYIPTLDGLRAMAIALVVISHALPQENVYREIGHCGVLLFFSLSGYLITTKLLEEYSRNGKIDLPAFYIRRAFRILPAAFTYIFILSGLALLGLVFCDIKSIVAAVFFWINYIPVTIVAWKAGHFWSLSVEEHFYLIWPAVLIISRVVKGWRIAALLALVVCVWRSVGYDYHSMFHTDYIADTLLWGCCLAFFPKLNIRLPTILTLGLFAGFWFIEFGPFQGRSKIVIEHLWPTLILGVIVASPQNLIGRLLEIAPIRFLGRLSYSLYIWQQMFLGGQGNRLPWWLGFILAGFAAYISYRFIEKPFIAVGRRMVDRMTEKDRASGVVETT